MHLIEAERRWLENALDAVIPPDGDKGMKKSATQTGASEVYQDMVRLLPFTTAIGLRAAIYFIELMGPAFGLGRPVRFSSLSQGERTACLEGIYQSKVYLVRQMVVLVKSVACFAWGADDGVREDLGMGEPPKYVKRTGRTA